MSEQPNEAADRKLKDVLIRLEILENRAGAHWRCHAALEARFDRHEHGVTTTSGPPIFDATQEADDPTDKPPDAC